MKILTVDDSRLLPPYFKEIFRELKNVTWVGHAFNMAEGMEIMRREQPDVVFLDICLAEGSGFELLKNIKKEYPAVNVFMLSNNKSDFYIKKSQQQGALFLIDKTNEFHLIPSFLEALNIAMKGK